MRTEKNLKHLWICAMIEFEYPYAILLIILFILGNIYLKPKEDSLLISGLISQGSVSKNLLFIPKWLGIIFLLLSLASPISKKEFFPHKEPAHGVMIAFDLSGSMSRDMIGGRRIDVAKKLASEFVRQRKDDHVGLVGFANFAYVASPLTYDTKAVSEIIDRFYLGIAGQYTALRDGLFMSIRMLKKSKAKQKIIVLLTDGEDKGSKVPLKALVNAIKKEDVKIYSIGIGNGGDYNANFLQYISDISGGKFYQASSADALKNVYEQINKLEKSDLERQKIVQKFYYYQYPLFLSLLFFIAFLYFKIRQGK